MCGFLTTAPPPFFVYEEPTLNHAWLAACDGYADTDLIATFLARNAHPRMAANTPVLPETVVNQLSLWAKERTRASYAPVHWYREFATADDFRAAVQYARDMHAYVWSRDAGEGYDAAPRSVLAVRADAHERMKGFLQQQKQKRAAADMQVG